MHTWQMQHTITTNLDNGYFNMGIFIHPRKAFDIVHQHHNILLDKFEFYGIRGVSSDFLRSYLSNRLHFVLFDNVRSQLPCVR